MFSIDWFGKKKREKEEAISKTLAETWEVQKDAREVQKGNLEIAKEGVGKLEDGADKLVKIGTSLQEDSSRLNDLYLKNTAKEQSLDEREILIRSQESDTDERIKKVRANEIVIAARKSDVRTQESVIKQQNKTIVDEKRDLEKRELSAEKLAEDSRKTQKEYDEKNQGLESKDAALNSLEASLSSQSTDIEARNKESEEAFARAESLENELSKNKRILEEEFEAKSQSLQEKIDEYDRKVTDIENVKNTAGGIAFDDSEDGRQAKIVVFDAIRKGEKLAEDLAKEFELLRGKYGKGTFRGFATPLSQIDEQLEEFKLHANQVKQHAKESSIEDLMQKILDEIDEHLLEAVKCKDRWEFSESFLHICQGLATCKNYSIILEIINNFSGQGESEDESAENDDFPNYYEILEVNENANEKTIKAAYRKMAKQFHPDKAVGNKEKEVEFGEKMKNINKAKSVLCDEEKRAKYDRERKGSKS